MAESNINRAGYLRESFHYFHLKDTAGQELDFHFHEFDKLVILLEGSVNYLVEEQSYALPPWSVLLVRHHAIHKAVIDRSRPYRNMRLFSQSLTASRVYSSFCKVSSIFCNLLCKS